MNSFGEIIKLIRVHQWTKNLLIFVPGFFAGTLTAESLTTLTMGYFAFCFFSSCVYIFNDYLDRDADRLDEKKKNRPLVSGSVSIGTAFGVAGALAIGGGVLVSLLPLYFIYVIGSYLCINLLYSIWLKHVPIVDVVIIAVGFLLRVFGGGFLIEVELSKWLILLTFFVSLLIAFAKRRNELLSPNPEAIRPALKGYNIKFTDLSITALSGICVIFYVMYTIDPEVTVRLNSSYIYLTVIWVILGFLRYLQQVFVNNNAGAPAELLIEDHWLKGIIILWLGSFYYFLYV